MANILAGYENGLGPAPSSQAPGDNPYLKGILNSQVKQAQDYRTNLEKTRSNQFNVAQGQSQRGLADSMRDVDTSLNRRGLLRSGMRQSGQANVIGQANAGLAKTRSDINSQTENNAQQLESNAINTAGNMAGMGMNLGGSLIASQKAGFDAQQQNNAYQNQLYGDIGSAAGTGIGLAQQIAKQRGQYGGGYNSGYGNTPILD